METEMVKNSFMILMIALLVGCVKATHEDTELGAMDKFWSVLGSGDKQYLESLKKKQKKHEEN
jgi:hypothetical protein